MPLDCLDQEFHDLWLEFCAAHGLDATHAVHEDWERWLRQHVYCPHQFPKPRCPYCTPPHPPRSPYDPA